MPLSKCPVGIFLGEHANKRFEGDLGVLHPKSDVDKVWEVS